MAAPLLPRGAALAALLCALLVALAPRGATAAVSCPSAGASGNVTCYEGGTYSGPTVTGGPCSCTCGATQATADSDYTNAAGNTEETVFLAASSSACTSAACATNFPKFCGASTGFVSASYTTATAEFASQALKTASQPVGSICATMTATCSAGANNPCPNWLTSGTLTAFTAIEPEAPVTAAQMCSTLVSQMPAGTSATTLCITNNCNAPPSSSGAVRSGAVVAAVIAVAAAVAAAL